MRDKNSDYEAVRLKGANDAIQLMGGPAMTAKRLSSITGKRVTRHRVTAWRKYGLAPPWHPIIHQITGIPLADLDPEIYPPYLFEQ